MTTQQDGGAATTTAIGSLIGSLADNKAALGRRYAEWAVSAPTLESAVAAAAMAQDELGHSRSTYPVLKSLGVDVPEDGFGGDRRLALLDHELPDWNALIAANLLVDGVLTTFVAACVGSSIEPMAARAKKILQEEGSHRVHGEAWARRLCRDETQRDAFVERLLETWKEASRWVGPDDDPGYAAALEAGQVKQTPAYQRALVRDWLTALLAAEGVELTLPEPDFAGWDPERRR
jgi:1,2-phenylacetyl-CoA epoxidase catalytic subunit